jgi:hypothetical protein
MTVFNYDNLKISIRLSSQTLKSISEVLLLVSRNDYAYTVISYGILPESFKDMIGQGSKQSQTMISWIMSYPYGFSRWLKQADLIW